MKSIGAVVVVITLASCAPLPPHEPGCEWVGTLPLECRGHAVKCSGGFAAIECDGKDIITNAPCSDADGYPDVDYTSCFETIEWAWD
jgi:hypothetical protein